MLTIEIEHGPDGTTRSVLKRDGVEIRRTEEFK